VGVAGRHRRTGGRRRLRRRDDPEAQVPSQQYLALVGPVNAAQTVFSQAAKGWTNSTTDAQAESAAVPLIAAFEKLDNGLIDDSWPSADKSDVRALASADGSVIGDLQGLANVNLLSGSGWTTTFARDEQAVGVAVTEVRHDLGLPPAQS